MTRTLTAFFDSHGDAMRAVERLAEAGIPRDSVRVLPDTEVSSASSGTSTSSYDVKQDEKGFWQSLADFFFPEEDRYSYTEAMSRGSVMVSATVDDSIANQAEDILEETGTVNISEREEAWRSEGWRGWPGSSTSNGTQSSASATRLSGNEEGTIPVAEEELRIGKREVDKGRVRVRSYVVETPVSEDVRLRDESVRVERRPIDEAIASKDADELFRERTIEVEERGEEAVVSKTARVREEVAIGKDVEERTETISDKVRHTEVKVEDDRSGESRDTPRRRSSR